LLEVLPERLDSSPATTRRRWSSEAKSRLVAEALATDANVSAIARRNGMAPSQLFGWRRAAIQQGTVRPAASAAPDLAVEAQSATAAMIEIVVAGAIVRVGANVAEDHLLRVLRAVRQA
jgi:transposase